MVAPARQRDSNQSTCKKGRAGLLQKFHDDNTAMWIAGLAYCGLPAFENGKINGRDDG